MSILTQAMGDVKKLKQVVATKVNGDQPGSNEVSTTKVVVLTQVFPMVGVPFLFCTYYYDPRRFPDSDEDESSDCD